MDIEGRMLGLLLVPVLIDGDSGGCRDGFADIDGASLDSEEGWLKQKVDHWV